MLATPLCRQLGIAYPIFSVGMGALAGAELAAAVSNAGACGVLGLSRAPASFIHQEIKRTRTLTERPFGANIILARPSDEQVAACLEARVPLLVFFWGDPAPYVESAHRCGTKVFVQVGSVEEAQAAVHAGIDGVIAQGEEAGGHVRGTIALSTLLPAMVEAIQPVPVIASGGIATGRGVVAALSLGAQAVSLGTRFLCSAEASATPEYKARVVQSGAADTVKTSLFDVGWPGAPHRVLRNKIVAEWEEAGRPVTGQRPGEQSVIGTVPRFAGTVDVVKYSSGSYPSLGFTPDIEYAVLYAGVSCELVHDIPPAGQIVRALVREAEEVIAQLPRG